MPTTAHLGRDLCPSSGAVNVALTPCFVYAVVLTGVVSGVPVHYLKSPDTVRSPVALHSCPRQKTCAYPSTRVSIEVKCPVCPQASCWATSTAITVSCSPYPFSGGFFLPWAVNPRSLVSKLICLFSHFVGLSVTVSLCYKIHRPADPEPRL